MFTKIYLTIATVLRCLKNCSDIFQYFNGNSAVIICSLFSRQKLCVLVSVVLFRLIKVANWLLFLNASFRGGLKMFYESILVSSLG